MSTIPRRDPDSHGSEKTGAVLAESGYELREVGHNVIFAMLAIKAFRLILQVATPQRVEGLCNLIRSFKPWRDTGPDGTVQPPPFADQAATSRYTLTEASAAIDRFMGYGQGFAGHMLTFGQALVELAAMGDVELVEQSRTAFCQFVTVTRKGPAAESRKIPAPPEPNPTQRSIVLVAT